MVRSHHCILPTGVRGVRPGISSNCSYIYVPETENTYQKVLIDTFEPEGGDPEIEAVFFFNPGTNNQNKLVIICSWLQVHQDFRGKLYATFVYEAQFQTQRPPGLNLRITSANSFTAGASASGGTEQKPPPNTRPQMKSRLLCEKSGIRWKMAGF
jgi:hypothetical protein